MSVDDILHSTKPRSLGMRVAKLAAGIRAVAPAGKTFDIGGRTITLDEVVAKLERFERLLQAPSTTLAAYEETIVNRDKEMPDIVPFVVELCSALVGFLGRTSPRLAELGIQLRKKPQPRTTAEKKAAAEKRQATRDARHVMGRRQREAVHPQEEAPPKPGDASGGGVAA